MNAAWRHGGWPNSGLPSAHKTPRHPGLLVVRARTSQSGSSSSPSQESTESAGKSKAKMAVAAKISAARSLARKLAEEKQAAAAAAQLSSQAIIDAETAAELIRSAEAEVAELAKEAAAADAAAQAAVRTPQLAELQRLKSENAALQNLLMQLAADREEAEKKLAQLREYGVEGLDGNGSSPVAAVTNSEVSSVATPPEPCVGVSCLRAAIDSANSSGHRVATLPEGPAAVGSTVRVLYNLAAGPLPHHSAQPVLKMGLNRWETQAKFTMERERSMSEVGDWWAADVALPKLLFRIDFVVEDKSSGAVDNNGGKDFTLELAGAPTSEAVTAARLELLEQAEAAAIANFDAEEERLRAALVSAAEGAAKEARLAFASSHRKGLLAEARAVIAERRDPSVISVVRVEDHREGIFTWGRSPMAGSTAILLYNKASGPLASADAIVAHIGYDGWWMKDKRVLPLRKITESENKKWKLSVGGDWWVVEVPVWNTAAILDFVFSNDALTAWDNGGGIDYHTAVRGGPSGDKLVQLVFQALEAARAESAARGENLAARRVLQRAAIKSVAGRRRRELQRRFLYTHPVAPRAGNLLTVFYNPDRTVLRGRPDVFVRGSFNRWTHPKLFGPIKMEPAVPDAGGLGFYKATIDVPGDAHVVDLVFADSADQHGGFYDTNRGLDYHIPILGGSGVAQPLRIAHVASEMAPIAKAGGLGDVVTALGRAVQEEGHHVEVVLPKYDCIDYSAVKGLILAREFGCENTSVKVWRGEVEGLKTTFLEPCNGMFWVGQIYTDMNSDRHRFGMFCAAALRYLLFESGAPRPDIVHAHDWQSAPVTFMDRQGQKLAATFTIHNLNYGADLIGRAMAAADVATTVSPTYASEVGGHPSVAPHHAKFYGIRNGIDIDIWDPSSDPFLPLGYSVEDVTRGKQAAKAALRQRMGLAEGDVPIVGCVTRLTHQKGIHLIKHAAWRAVERGAQFVLLGSAPEPKVQAEFDALANDLGRQYPDRARLWFAYDEPLSHLIYAGSDLFLVPSMFEPCGLTQMIAMRYGTIPVVRRTGGLADTVFDVDDDVERAAQLGMAVNGYSFDGADAAGMDYGLNRALNAWYGEKQRWAELVETAMTMDWSWAGPAQDYIELYFRALKTK